jgi:hypothetical protein
MPARRDQRRAGAMLEPAPALVDGVEQEQVALERRLAARVPEPDRGLADPLRVGEKRLAIEVRQGAGDDELVDDARRAEAAAPEAAELDRVVDQLVVVGGNEFVRRAGRLRREGGRDLPVGARPASASRCGSASRPSTRRHRPVPLKKPRSASRKAARTERSKAYTR